MKYRIRRVVTPAGELTGYIVESKGQGIKQWTPEDSFAHDQLEDLLGTYPKAKERGCPPLVDTVHDQIVA
jgi:hypothetical protein